MIPVSNSCEEDELCDIRHIHLDRVRRARQTRLSDEETIRIAEIFKLLGDPTRLHILTVLREGEMCVCDLAAALKMTESAISHQLRRMRDLLIVKRRRDGQILYYSLADSHIETLLEMALSHVRE